MMDIDPIYYNYPLIRWPRSFESNSNLRIYKYIYGPYIYDRSIELVMTQCACDRKTSGHDRNVGSGGTSPIKNERD